MDNKMFCFQCQETARGTGCTVAGVCGKSAEVAAMQDLLVYVTKGLSFVATRLREEGKKIPAEVNHLVTVNLFTTITNANFDIEAIEDDIERLCQSRHSFLKSSAIRTICRMQRYGAETESFLLRRLLTMRWASFPRRMKISVLSGN